MGCVPMIKNGICVRSNHDEVNKKKSVKKKISSEKYCNIEKEGWAFDSMSQANLKINRVQFIQEYTGSPYEKYEKVHMLGEGSYGKVYKVTEKGTKSFRAIKEIKKIKKTSSELEKLTKEINILKTLDHPNILKILEFYDSEEYFYIVTELCLGGELFDKIIKFKYLSEQIASNIMRQLLSAVNYCHENHIIHRDLKPENILLESSSSNCFNIKIIDFGTGEVFKSNKLLKKQIGTPYYIAPEVLKNEYNEKCDIWSCGVIMYILLSGSPPFYGKNDDEIYEAVRNGKFSFKHSIWHNVSDEAKSLIKSLLEIDINKRPSADKALKHKWFHSVSDSSETFETENVSIMLTSFNNKNIILKQALKNLKNFRAERKLQQATLYFMIHNIVTSEEISQLRNIFLKLDNNNDGRLTKEEILAGFKLCKWISITEKEIEKIMRLVDIDKNGFIEYQEFLLATIDIKKLLTDENLYKAFNMFDKDKSGKISSDELKTVLRIGNEKSNEKVWKKLIKEIDSDEDGEISFEEFKTMMCNLVTSA